VDTLLEGIETSAGYKVAFRDRGYTTNVPLADLTAGMNRPGEPGDSEQIIMWALMWAFVWAAAYGA
jgi:hypothetical protein